MRNSWKRAVIALVASLSLVATPGMGQDPNDISNQELPPDYYFIGSYDSSSGWICVSNACFGCRPVSSGGSECFQGAIYSGLCGCTTGYAMYVDGRPAGPPRCSDKFGFCWYHA